MQFISSSTTTVRHFNLLILYLLFQLDVLLTLWRRHIWECSISVTLHRKTAYWDCAVGTGNSHECLVHDVTSWSYVAPVLNIMVFQKFCSLALEHFICKYWTMHGYNTQINQVWWKWSLIGASLSKPHTSMTALRTCVCMLACLDRPLTENFK